MTIKEISTDKLAWLADLQLAQGGHGPHEKQYCFNEAAAYMAEQPHSDMPPCVSGVIRKFTMRLNDRWDDARRQKLKPYIVPALGTNTGRIEDERRRAYIVTDWSCRVLLPMLFEFRGWADWAARLRELPEVTDKDTAIQARDLTREARTYAYAAAAAKRDFIERVDASALECLERLIEVGRV